MSLYLPSLTPGYFLCIYAAAPRASPLQHAPPISSAANVPSRAPPPAPPPRPPAARTKIVVALHPYTGAADGELTMEKGDEITVTDEGDNSGWWKGGWTLILCKMKEFLELSFAFFVFCGT